MEYPISSPEIRQCFEEGDQLLKGSRSLVCIGDMLTLSAVSLVLRESTVRAYTTQEEAIRAIRDERIDFLFATEDLEQGNGIALIQQVKQISPDTNCLLFLRRETQAVVRDAIDAGADGVMFVSSICRVSDGDVMRALRAVSSGATYFPENIRRAAAYGEAEPLALPGGLSDREREVLVLLSEGATNKEIATQLIVSAETVKSHVSTIISKLGVRDRTAAAVLAIKAGLDRQKGPKSPM